MRQNTFDPLRSLSTHFPDSLAAMRGLLLRKEDGEGREGYGKGGRRGGK